MPADMSIDAAAESERPAPRHVKRFWRRPHPAAIVVALLVAAVLIVINGLAAEEADTYVYGWPWTYGGIELIHRDFPPRWAPLRADGWNLNSLPWQPLAGNVGVMLALSLLSGAILQWRSRRPLWQLSLSDLLVLTAGISAATAWIAASVAETRRQFEVLSSLEQRAGCSVYQHAESFVELWDLLGVPEGWRPGERIVRASIQGQGLQDPTVPNDEALGQLGTLHELRSLHIARERASAETLQRLAQLPELYALDLNEVALAPGDRHELAALRQLTDLGLVDCELTDDDLQHVGQLSKLSSLDLQRNPAITDRGLLHLYGLKNLTYLDLTQPDVSDDGLAALQAALPGATIVDD